jgi:LPXTG-motif cell wall-anchored protein
LIANIDGAAVTTTEGATLTMRNSTVTGIGDGADGIRVGGPTTLVNVTLSSIEDYGIVSFSQVAAVPVSLTNTIINDTRDASCFGSLVVTSGGGNITDDATCGLTQPGDLQTTDPLLGALADNGGRTRTLLPQTGSPAIDGGVVAGCPAVDQRGLERPADGNGDALAVCDSGAVEVGAVQPTTTTTTTTVAPIESTAPTAPAVTAPAAAVPTTSMVTLLPETGAGANTGIGLIGAILLGLGSFLVLAVARRRPAS